MGARGRGRARGGGVSASRKRKYFAVSRGRDGASGVFDNWEACRQLVEGVPGARFKSFPNRLAAAAYVASGVGVTAALDAAAADAAGGLGSAADRERGGGAGGGGEVGVTALTGRTTGMGMAGGAGGRGGGAAAATTAATGMGAATGTVVGAAPRRGVATRTRGRSGTTGDAARGCSSSAQTARGWRAAAPGWASTLAPTTRAT